MKRITLFSILFSTLFFGIVSVGHAAPVNVNTATPEEIAEALTGIGPSKAIAISKHCRATKCKSPEDLLAVKGIGEKTLKKIAKDLRFKKKK